MSKGFATLRAGGSPEMLPRFKELWPKINAGVWMRVPGTPLVVYRVNAEWIRGRGEPDRPAIYQDFCLGGNSEAYPWMMPDMIIIEQWLPAFEQWATVIHELAEIIAIARDHMTYDKAHHNRANKSEREYRARPANRTAIWTDLVKQYQTFLAKSPRKSDRVGTHSI